LLFSSIDPEVAEARGVPIKTLSVIFMLLLAITVAEAIQVVGVLLGICPDRGPRPRHNILPEGLFPQSSYPSHSGFSLHGADYCLRLSPIIL
jgi:hypothetical protein